jgi:hypothetical protein
MRRIVALVALLLMPVSLAAQTVSSADGPFGLRMGMTVRQLRALGTLKLEQPSVYSFASPPKPHPKIESFLLVVTEAEGLCKLIATSKTFDTSVYGTELRDQFDSFQEALEAKYGTSEKVDRLEAGSIWDEGKDWMMALVQKERHLSAIWLAETQLSLPDHIRAISLEASALSRNRGWVSIAYEFWNIDPCLKNVKGAANSAL